MASGPTPSSPTVLVVEDEMVLRMRAVDIVEDAGFNSVEAVNADEALSILESRSDISVLFTDIQMPGSLDGLKLAHAVHKRWPAIKIILVSGQVNLSDAEKPADSRFFGKPLETEQMIAEIKEMVGKGALKISALEESALAAGPGTAPVDTFPNSTSQESLTAENGSLRLLLAQAAIDAKALLAQAGIDAKEREAADKLQKLILDELHHRIKNTLATVSAIASQASTATSIEHGRQAINGRLVALGRVHDLLMQVSWASTSLAHTIRGATEPYDSQGIGRFNEQVIRKAADALTVIRLGGAANGVSEAGAGPTDLHQQVMHAPKRDQSAVNGLPPVFDARCSAQALGCDGADGRERVLMR